MSKLFSVLVLGTLVAPAFAQQTPPAAPPPGAPPGSVVATTNNPNLAVASIRLENGTRLSKVIGASVYNGTNDKIGAVDDLVMTAGDKVTMAIISVGGFLGVGGKLVAVPWSDLRQDGDKVVLAGASKDSLNGMPNFQY